MAVRLMPARRAAAAIAAAAILLAGCSASPAPMPTSAPISTRTAEPAVTPGAPDHEKPLEIGESASLASGTDGVLTLTVQEISVLDTCPGRGVPDQQPELEHFVVLDVTVVTSETDEPIAIPPGAFQLADGNGVLQRVSTTEASWSCFEDAELLPAFVPAGEPVTGKVVLDAASAHGQVRYAAGEEILLWAY